MSRAILLLNMGGPSNLDEVELFLRNMFADKYILQTNPLLRKFIGNIIVKKRLEEAQENYKAIGSKSPLLEITQNLAKKVEKLSSFLTYPIMRYVPPFAKERLLELQKKGIKELVLFSMYPHYSTTTTQSSIEDVLENLEAINYHPKISIIKSYYKDDDYIEIQAKLIQEALDKEDPSDIKLIISAHGLPLSIIQKGDPYERHIEINSALLEAKLKSKGIEFKEVQLAYQSKVGKGKWLEPNLVDILRKPSHLKVLIFPIAFTVDNSETIFELDIEHKEIAKKIGYDYYKVVACPNDRDDFAHFITQKVKKI